MKRQAMMAEFCGGKLDGKKMSLQRVWIHHWNGRVTENYSLKRMMGCCVPREELDSQPMVDGYLSPMWDGNGLRYETQKVYDALSR